MALIDDVKLRLRITTNALDADINGVIEAGKAELKRLGLDATKVDLATDPLIVEAIKSYCSYQFMDDVNKKAEYRKGWETQSEALSLSSGYRAGESV